MIHNIYSINVEQSSSLAFAKTCINHDHLKIHETFAFAKSSRRELSGSASPSDYNSQHNVQLSNYEPRQSEWRVN